MTRSLCFSGGANGADHAWGLMALEKKHDLIHFTFSGHKPAVDKNLQLLSEHELKTADPYVLHASKFMKRKYPSNKEHVNNLIRRNWYQIRFAERIYAIANFLQEDPGTLKISGGTAWAATMYVDRWYMEKNFKECELYLFDMQSNTWMQWWETWKTIERPPIPYGRYAGIGSRDISDEGIRAIFEVYG
jgi:hypothetical protein